MQSTHTFAGSYRLRISCYQEKNINIHISVKIKVLSAKFAKFIKVPNDDDSA